MTKMTLTKKIKKGIVIEKRNFTPAECIELEEMLRLINARKFEAGQIRANTALVPDGQKLADQTDAVARLLENVKNQYVASKLIECGYKSGTICDVNLRTGEVTVQNGTPNS